MVPWTAFHLHTSHLQKRSMKTNIRLVLSPIFLCLLLVLIQMVVDNELDKPSNRCGCTCVDTDGNGQCERRCGIEYSTLDQGFSCPMPHPPAWPPLLQIPEQQFRAVRTDSTSYQDLPNDSCKRTGSCPITMLITGRNQTLGQSTSLFILLIFKICQDQVILILLMRLLDRCGWKHVCKTTECRFLWYTVQLSRWSLG